MIKRQNYLPSRRIFRVISSAFRLVSTKMSVLHSRFKF